MNTQLKSILLTILTLSIFVIALVELSGVSSTALFNKYGIGKGGNNSKNLMPAPEVAERTKRAGAMPKTILEFTEPDFSFGKAKEGETLTHAFHFKNKGTAPLLIINALASCGCTVPSFPKEPIAPGGEGDVVIKFDSRGRKGHQKKNILILSNAQQDRMSIGFDVDVE